MSREAIIKIISTQTTEDGTDTGEMTVQGTVLHENGKSFIEYTEASEEMGDELMKIAVLDGETVSIIREGGFSSEMTVQNGVRHTTYYKTPYGEFTMGVYGKSVTFFRSGAKSVIKMSYTLDFNNGYISESSMNIYIEEK